MCRTGNVANEDSVTEGLGKGGAMIELDGEVEEWKDDIHVFVKLY